jgi:hypothetical protein
VASSHAGPSPALVSLHPISWSLFFLPLRFPRIVCTGVVRANR